MQITHVSEPNEAQIKKPKLKFREKGFAYVVSDLEKKIALLTIKVVRPN